VLFEWKLCCYRHQLWPVVSWGLTGGRTDLVRTRRLQDFSSGVQKRCCSRRSSASLAWCTSAALWEFSGQRMSLQGAWWSSAPQPSLAGQAKAVAWLDLAHVSFGLLPFSQSGERTDDQAANSPNSWPRFQRVDTALPKLVSLPLVPRKGRQEVGHIWSNTSGIYLCTCKETSKLDHGRQN